jgi:ABC-2 type transport system permease protein
VVKVPFNPLNPVSTFVYKNQNYPFPKHRICVISHTSNTKPMFTLLSKEINSFLSSLIGYIVIVVFLAINSLFLWVFDTDFNIINSGYSSIDGLFMIAPFVFLFLIPAITMRSFADEKKAGTIELLLTKPLTDLQIILSKYFAGFLLVIFSLLPTLVYFISVYTLGFPKGNIDVGASWGSYIGLLLLGGAFVSIGLFSSTLTDKQVLAFVLSVFLCGFMYIGFELIYSLEMFGKIDLLIQSIGINAHYISLSRGVIDTRDLIYFLSLIAFFILLSKISIEKRKW